MFMIRKLLSLVLLVSFFSCEEMEDKKINAEPGSVTSIEWTKPSRNLGKINEGQKLQISYHFKNTGSKPLIIKSVIPGCGCTLADYPKEPIAPGKEADIIASFDSKGREGHQHKEIQVVANTQGKENHTLSFDLEVVKK
jgi:hypothetical protein